MRSNIIWAQYSGDGDYAALYVDGKLLFESWSHPQDPLQLLQQLEGVDVGRVDLMDVEDPFVDDESWPELASNLTKASEEV